MIPTRAAGARTVAAAQDAQLLFPVLFLVGIGIVMVYSASSAIAVKKFGSDYYFLKKQALFAVVGIVALVGCRHIPYTVYRPLAYPLLAVSVLLLIAVLLPPFGVTAGGSSRWLRLGPVRFQPSEFARIALIVYMAYSLERKSDKIRELAVGFLPHVVVLGVLSALILKQPDFGSVAILAMLTWLMMFVGGVRLTYLMSACAVMAVGAAVAITHAGYRTRRLMSFLDPWQYSSDAGYQIVHSLMAFGSGGWWGAGIGNGVQKLFYLPEPHTDFILSIIAEESGFIGICTVIVLFGLLIFRGFVIAFRVQDTFGSLLASGITILLAMEAFINIAGVMGLIPTKGMALPFLSYGGTALIVSCMAVGILLNLSTYQKSTLRGSGT